MTTEMVTSATGSSLQRLAEAAWQRTAEGSELYYEASTGRHAAGDRPGACPAACARPGSSRASAW